MKEGLVKTLLRHIFGILPVIGYPLRHGENSLFVTKDQFPESLRISALCGVNQRTVGVLVYTRSTRRFHESDPPPPPRHKVKKVTSAPATAHIERTGISSTDGERAECDTNREWIGVSMVVLLSASRFLVWRRCHVDACSLRILFTGKMLAATKNAIRVPETGE